MLRYKLLLNKILSIFRKNKNVHKETMLKGTWGDFLKQDEDEQDGNNL